MAAPGRIGIGHGSVSWRTRRVCSSRNSRSAVRMAGRWAETMAAASRAALVAPASPMASVPTGTPPGIWTIDSSESRPLSAWRLDGHAEHGQDRVGGHHARQVRGPARSRDDHLEPAPLGPARVLRHPRGRAVRRHDGALVGHAEARQHLVGVAHRLPVRLAPHDDGDQRRLAHGAPTVSPAPIVSQEHLWPSPSARRVPRCTRERSIRCVTGSRCVTSRRDASLKPCGRAGGGETAPVESGVPCAGCFSSSPSSAAAAPRRRGPSIRSWDGRPDRCRRSLRRPPPRRVRSGSPTVPCRPRSLPWVSRIPGHWEQPYGPGQYYVPPLTVCDQATGICSVLPGGVQGPVEQRPLPQDPAVLRGGTTVVTP